MASTIGGMHFSIVSIPDSVRSAADRAKWEEEVSSSLYRVDHGRVKCTLCNGRNRGGSQVRAHHYRVATHVRGHLQDGQLIPQRRILLLECFCRLGSAAKHFHCPDCGMSVGEADLPSHLLSHGLASYCYASYWRERTRVLATRAIAGAAGIGSVPAAPSARIPCGRCLRFFSSQDALENHNSICGTLAAITAQNYHPFAPVVAGGADGHYLVRNTRSGRDHLAIVNMHLKTCSRPQCETANAQSDTACKHILSARCGTPKAVTVGTLPESLLASLTSAFSADRLDVLLRMKAACDQAGVPLIVEFSENRESLRNFSVAMFVDNTIELIRHTRAHVVYDGAARSPYAACKSCTNRHCIHVVAAAWMSLEFPAGRRREALEALEPDARIIGYFPSIVATLIFALCRYWLQSKKIPTSVVSLPYALVSSPLSLVPSETSCPYGCEGVALNIRQTHSAIVYDRDGIMAAAVVEKCCPNCSRSVHYKDHTAGVFNYDNRVLMTHALLATWYIPLQSSLMCFRRLTFYQLSTSIGGLVATLERSLRRGKLPAKKLRNGFYAFEALLDHPLNFKCVTCGDAPPVLIFDGNMKTLVDDFGSLVDRSIPPDFDGHVPANGMIPTIIQDILSRALNDDRSMQRPVPLAGNLMYMDASVCQPQCLNTEYLKYAPLGDLLARVEEQGGMTAELFDTILQRPDIPAVQLRALCSTVGLEISQAASRRDIIEALHAKISSLHSEDDSMLKLFPRLLGTTGDGLLPVAPMKLSIALK